jgi:hypothetical protein
LDALPRPDKRIAAIKPQVLLLRSIAMAAMTTVKDAAN